MVARWDMGGYHPVYIINLYVRPGRLAESDKVLRAALDHGESLGAAPVLICGDLR